MPGPTFQDLLTAYSEDLFVGRSDEIAIFERMITADRPPCLILAISGQGGVGKTTLLERFRGIASAHDVPTALADEGQLTIFDVLEMFATHLDQAGKGLPRFAKRLQHFRKLRQQVNSDEQAPRGFFDLAVRGATRVGVHSFKKHIPIAGDIAEVLLTKEAEDRLVRDTGAFATYVAGKFTNKDDQELLLDPIQNLTALFLSDLSSIAASTRVILCFDTYEHTAVVVDDWLRDVIQGRFGRFSGNVLFVIVGRHPLNQAWTRFSQAIRQVELCEFTDQEAREYLTRRNITEPRLQDQFMRLSDQLPVLLAFLISAPGGAYAEVAGTAVERFLQGATASQREIALVSSIPRVLNRDILGVLFDPADAAAVFNWLCCEPFVRQTTAGWIYHDVVRTFLLRHFHEVSPQLYAASHERLVDHYQLLVADLGLTDDLCWAHPAWIRYEAERLYHLLSQNPDRYVPHFLNALIDAIWSLLNDSLADHEAFIRLSRVVTQVSEELDRPALRRWAKNVAVVSPSDLFANKPSTDTVEAIFRVVASYHALPGLDPTRRALALALSGALAFNAEQYQRALPILTDALSIGPDVGLFHSWRGATYYQLEDYPAALADLDTAIRLQSNHENIYFWRGLTHCELKDYSAALADFNMAIQLRPENGDNYWGRGLVCFELKDYSAALADFTTAIRLQPDDGYNHYWRGRTYFELKDYPLAAVNFSRAIELQPDDPYNLAWRGRTQAAAGNTPAALADLQRAEELLVTEGKPAYVAAAGYIQIDRHDDAIRLLRLAFQRSPILLDDIATDADFDPIRQAPEFRALLAEFGSPASASPGPEEP